MKIQYVTRVNIMTLVLNVKTKLYLKQICLGYVKNVKQNCVFKMRTTILLTKKKKTYASTIFINSINNPLQMDKSIKHVSFVTMDLYNALMKIAMVFVMHVQNTDAVHNVTIGTLKKNQPISIVINVFMDINISCLVYYNVGC